MEANLKRRIIITITRICLIAVGCGKQNIQAENKKVLEEVIEVATELP